MAASSRSPPRSARSMTQSDSGLVSSHHPATPTAFSSPGPSPGTWRFPLLKTVEATPQPRVVIAVGDCARDCGVFRGRLWRGRRRRRRRTGGRVDSGVPSSSDRHHRGAARRSPVDDGRRRSSSPVPCSGSGRRSPAPRLPKRLRVTAAAVLVWAACALEAAAAIHVLATGHPIVLRSAELLPLTGVTLVLNPLGAFFVLLVVMVAVPATLHGIGYAASRPRHPDGGWCLPDLRYHVASGAHAPGASPRSWCCGS